MASLLELNTIKETLKKEKEKKDHLYGIAPHGDLSQELMPEQFRVVKNTVKFKNKKYSQSAGIHSMTDV